MLLRINNIYLKIFVCYLLQINQSGSRVCFMAERIGLGRKALELLKEVAYCDPEHIPKHNDAAIKEILMQVSIDCGGCTSQQSLLLHYKRHSECLMFVCAEKTMENRISRAVAGPTSR